MAVKYDEKSCGIIVFREEAGQQLFLLLHYPGGHWDFPKGHVEEGENEMETARRELLEETGINDLQFIDGYREPMSYKYYNTHRFNPPKMSHKQVIFFLGSTKTSEIKISHEHQGHQWLPYKEALEALTFESGKNLLRKAKEFC